MPLSNATIAGGVFGLASGALLGAIIGKNLSEGAPGDSPMPEALGLLGAIAGGVLFAAVANNLAGAGTTTTTTSSNTVTNGTTTLPPAGA
jgi:hypothetical protein